MKLLPTNAWPTPALVAAALCATAGCGTPASSPDAGGGGGSDFEITVSEGNPPTFGWPGANALGLSVTEYPATSNRLWTLGVAGTTGFASGVTYGSVPAVAFQVEPGSGAPPALVDGHQYAVGVTREDGKGASRTFTASGTASGADAGLPAGDGGAALGDGGAGSGDGGTGLRDGGSSTTSDGGTAAPPGLKLWLSSDEGVTESSGEVWLWASRTGSNIAIGPNMGKPLLVQNVLNGKPVVRFDGKSTYLMIDGLDAFRADYSVVLVGFGAAYNQDLFAATFPTEHGVLVETSALGKIRFLHRSPPGTTGGSDLDQGSTVSSSTSQILVFTKSAELQSFVNGQSTGAAKAATGVFGEAAKVALGRQGYSLSGRYLKGDLAEVRVYDHALSTAERQALEQELAAKYGITLQ